MNRKAKVEQLSSEWTGKLRINRKAKNMKAKNEQKS